MPKLKCWTINAHPSTPSECNWLPFNNIDFCLKNGILVSSLHYHVTDYSLSFSLSQHTFRFLATSTDCRSAFMLQVKCNRSSTNIKAFWRWKRNTHKQTQLSNVSFRKRALMLWNDSGWTNACHFGMKRAEHAFGKNENAHGWSVCIWNVYVQYTELWIARENEMKRERQRQVAEEKRFYYGAIYLFISN